MSVKTNALREKVSHVAKVRPATIQESDTVGAAIEALRQSPDYCVLVCQGRRLSGIFTERDYLMKIAGRVELAEPIGRHMTGSPVRADVDDTLGEAIETMNRQGIRHLPVVDADGSPAALVTVGAVIAYLAEHFPATVVNRPPQPHLTAEETDGA